MSSKLSAVRHPGVPFVAPFAVLILLPVVRHHLALGPWELPLRAVVLAAVLLVCSRKVIDLRLRSPLGSVLIGGVVFLVWVAPDLLWPEYRQHWLFQNALTGAVSSSLAPAWRNSWMVLASRSVRSVILVPIIEELFWRGWLMRWLVNADFRKVPLGAYTPRSFWITALLFASEHGPYWEVGLAAGIAYNWWILRTGKLGDCILAHAVTNGVLSAYVILGGKWEYWM